MKSAVQILLILITMVLTGCSYIAHTTGIQTRDKAYLSARSIPPLKIPPGIASSSFQSSFPVPNKQYPFTTEDVSLTPPSL